MPGPRRFPHSAALFALLAAFVVSAPASAVKRRLFVTSTSGTGDLSSWAGSGGLDGMAGADAVCRSWAAAASLPNAASYVAWISDGSTDAYCHLQGRTGTRASGCGGGALPGAGPWFSSILGPQLTGTLDELTGPDLLQYDEVWAAAGTWHDVFGIAPKRLLEASGATIADLKRE